MVTLRTWRGIHVPHPILCCSFLVLIMCPHHVVSDVQVINSDNITVKVYYDIELGLGGRIPDDGLMGMVVPVQPDDACSAIAPPPMDPLNNGTIWIALIKRFPCTFMTKMKFAVDAGYSAMIIYNTETFVHKNITNFLAFKGYPGIPSVLVSNDDGVALKTLYSYNSSYQILINPEMEQNLLSYILPFIMVIGACLVIMIIFAVVKLMRDRRRSMRHRLSSKQLRQIPTTKYKKGDHYDTCAICLDEYVEKEKLRVLPCGHVYHMKCIDQWLTKNRRVCPVCKGKVILPGMSDISDSDSDHAPDRSSTSANERTPLVAVARGNRPPRRNRSNRPNRGASRAATTTASASTSGDNRPMVNPVSPDPTSGSNATYYSSVLSVNADDFAPLLQSMSDTMQTNSGRFGGSNVTVVEVIVESAPVNDPRIPAPTADVFSVQTIQSNGHSVGVVDEDGHTHGGSGSNVIA